MPDDFTRECYGTPETRPEWFVDPIRWAWSKIKKMLARDAAEKEQD